MDTSVGNVQWRADDWVNFVLGATSASACNATTTGAPAAVLSAAFSSPSALGAPAASLDAQGMLPGRGFVIGGATLAQARFAPGPCPVPLNVAGGGAGGGCVATGGDSLAPFGLALLAGGPEEVVYADDGTPLPLGRAFVALPLNGTRQSPPAFRWFLSAYADIGQSVCRDLGTLFDSGWVDGATASLTLSFAALNPELGRVAHVRMGITASRGGLWAGSWRAASVLLDPYGAGSQGAGAGAPPLPGLTLGLDVAVCAYAAYLLLSTCKRSARGVLLARSDAGCGARSGARGAVMPDCCACACPSAAFCGALGERLPLLPTAVDWFAVGAVGAAIGTWAQHCAALGALQGALAALPRVVPTLDPATGAWAPGPGSVPAGGPGTAPPWAAVEALAGEALDAYVAFQTAAVLALIALALRSLKYMAFQAHLGVLVSTLRRSAGDMAHFGLPLALAFVMFGVWGMFLFGHHSDLWNTPSAAALEMFRFLMYDYDIAAMTAADTTGLTPLYYVAFMIGITNIMLWLVRAAPSAASKKHLTRTPPTPPPPSYPHIRTSPPAVFCLPLRQLLH